MPTPYNNTGTPSRTRPFTTACSFDGLPRWSPRHASSSALSRTPGKVLPAVIQSPLRRRRVKKPTTLNNLDDLQVWDEYDEDIISE